MRKLAWLSVAVMLAGCPLPTGGNGPRPASASSKPASPRPTARKASAPPVAVLSAAQLQQKGIVNAIQSTLVAGDLARGQSAIQLISDNGLGLISDNGLGLISDNGLGLIANGGAGYRVAQAVQEAEVYYANETVQGPLTWLSTFYKPDYRGEVRGIPTVDFKAKGKAAAPTEHYTWDALGIDLKNPTFPMKFPLDASLTYKINPIKSERFSFIKHMNLIFDMTILSVDPAPAKVVHKGFTGTYDMEVPLADGTKEIINMQAYDMTYSPGQELGTGIFYSPRTFKAKGENERGKLDMLIERVGEIGEATSVSMALEATHTAKKDGHQSRLKLSVSDANQQHSVVTDVETGVEAILDVAANRTGSGRVQVATTQEVLGSITWGGDGLGSIKFKDGATEKVRVF